MRARLPPELVPIPGWNGWRGPSGEPEALTPKVGG